MPGKHNRRIRTKSWFVGVDGEGGDISDPDALFGEKHVYQLLRIGKDTVENPTGLTFEECADFICSQSPHNIYVAFAFNYDITMMIRGLPKERVERLYDIKSRTPKVGNRWQWPVDYGQYQIDYIPSKFFKIRKRIGMDGDKPKYGPYITIFDVYPFFQSSFLAAIKKWETHIEHPSYTMEQQHDMIEKGKSMRAGFTGMTDEIRSYNELEIDLLERLMTDFRGVIRETGYELTSWHGPGALAEAMLREHNVPRKHDLYIMSDAQKTFREVANNAYYGGRFETTAIGPVAGPVYQYDINSAYPAAIRGLPCLLHGTWRQVHKRPSGEGLWVGHVLYDHDPLPHNTNLYNLPFRKDGNIIFPKSGQGTYWSVELLAAEAAGTHVTFAKGYVYEKNCDCQLFDFIQPIYDMRKLLGKSKKGMTLKLGLNSLYGKFAQSIGNPQFANPVWAGLITATCRSQIIRAYTGHTKDVYMIATDGIFVGEKLDNLKLGDQLGEWEETVHDDGMFLVQPGVYYLSSGGAKTRGIPFGRFHQRREDFELAFKRILESGGENHGVDIEVDNFITARQALSRRKWNLAGSWERTSRKVTFWCAPKRDWTKTRYDGRAYRTSPPLGDIFSKSVPFASVIGGTHRTEWGESRYSSAALQESERYREQPDWVEPMFDPDQAGGE